jgi:hypothetical protein
MLDVGLGIHEQSVFAVAVDEAGHKQSQVKLDNEGGALKQYAITWLLLQHADLAAFVLPRNGVRAVVAQEQILRRRAQRCERSDALRDHLGFISFSNQRADSGSSKQ